MNNNGRSAEVVKGNRSGSALGPRFFLAEINRRKLAGELRNPVKLASVYLLLQGVFSIHYFVILL